MDVVLTTWPAADRLIWTLATIGIAYGLGFVINGLVVRYLNRIAKRTEGAWDDVVTAELRKRIPLWSVLVGIRLSIGYWPLEARWVVVASSLVVALAVLSMTLAVAAVAVTFVSDAARRASPGLPLTGLARNVVWFVIVTTGVLVVLRGLGVEITPVLAALGVGGLAMALALQAPMSNLFAGLFIALAGHVRIGDYIRLEGGGEGYVDDLSWSATRIRAPLGNLIIVPNAKLAQAVVTNFGLPPDVGVPVEVTVAIGSDLALVERVAMDVASAVARQVPGGVPEAEPAVQFQAFTDVGVRCVVVVRSQRREDQFVVRHELVKRLHAGLCEAGIEIATLTKAEGKRPGAEGR